jgi:hypothetical protein
VQSFDKASLGRRQQLGQDRKVMAAGSGELERHIHIDADYMPIQREPQLTLASEQQFPGLMFLLAHQGVLAVGTESAVGSELSSGAGQAVVPAGFAIFGPSAGLEVPAAEGP